MTGLGQEPQPNSRGRTASRTAGATVAAHSHKYNIDNMRKRLSTALLTVLVAAAAVSAQDPGAAAQPQQEQQAQQHNYTAADPLPPFVRVMLTFDGERRIGSR